MILEIKLYSLPQNVQVLLLYPINFENPKSTNFMYPLEVIIKFSGFKSLILKIRKL